MGISGPRLTIDLAPCPTGWKFDPRETVAVGKPEVKSGVWPLKEHVDGKVIHTVIPRQRAPAEEFLNHQGRLFEPVREEDVPREIQHGWMITGRE